MEHEIIKFTMPWKGYTITIKGYQEPDDLETISGMFDYGDDVLNKKELDRFRSGELLNLVLVSSVFDSTGEIEGTDCLGGCFIKASDVEADIKDCVMHSELRELAVEDMKRKIKIIVKEHAK